MRANPLRSIKGSKGKPYTGQSTGILSRPSASDIMATHTLALAIVIIPHPDTPTPYCNKASFAPQTNVWLYQLTYDI